MAKPGRLVLQAVGDVHVGDQRPDDDFDAVRTILRDCDVLFANCEGPIGGRADQDHRCDGLCPAVTLQRAGFSVMSCANNHIFDNGRDGVLRTAALLAQHDIVSCGAGATPAAARRPAVIRREDRRVGFLAYTAVRGAGAPDHPEVANVHADTSYAEMEPNQPGTPPRILTKTRREDLHAVVDSVQEARATA